MFPNGNGNGGFGGNNNNAKTTMFSSFEQETTGHSSLLSGGPESDQPNALATRGTQAIDVLAGLFAVLFQAQPWNMGVNAPRGNLYMLAALVMIGGAITNATRGTGRTVWYAGRSVFWFMMLVVGAMYYQYGQTYNAANNITDTRIGDYLPMIFGIFGLGLNFFNKP